MPTTVEETEKTETSENKKDELLLDSLEIKGYRCFEHLTIEKLGRVNLIVGKNNVGKTALLEAFWIYANHDDVTVLHKIIFDRDEITNEKTMSHESLREYNFAIRNIFTGRPSIPNKDHSKRESLYFVISADFEWESYVNTILTSEENESRNSIADALFDEYNSKTTFLHYFYNSGFGMPQTDYYPRKERVIKNVFINSEGLQNNKLVEFWDIITLTPLEDEVTNSLRLLLPNLSRISFIGYPKGAKNRVPVIQVKNGKEPFPLKAYGEGLTRLLGLSLALVQCQDGILLIDEIENGLHYSALLDVWRLIFKTARDLNVQVFATTHSKDCIEAFTQAAIDDKESDGMLIRLENKDGKIRAVNFDEDELETVERRNIEVR